MKVRSDHLKECYDSNNMTDFRHVERGLWTCIQLPINSHVEIADVTRVWILRVKVFGESDNLVDGVECNTLQFPLFGDFTDVPRDGRQGASCNTIVRTREAEYVGQNLWRKKVATGPVYVSK